MATVCRSPRGSTATGAFPGAAHNRGLKIEVHMPKEGDLQVDTGDGSVDHADPQREGQDSHGRRLGARRPGCRRRRHRHRRRQHHRERRQRRHPPPHRRRPHRRPQSRRQGRCLSRATATSRWTDAWMPSPSRPATAASTLTSAPARRSIPAGAFAPVTAASTSYCPPSLQANIEASTNDGHISLGIPRDGRRHLQQLPDPRQDERRRPTHRDPHRRRLDPPEQSLNASRHKASIANHQSPGMAGFICPGRFLFLRAKPTRDLFPSGKAHPDPPSPSPFVGATLRRHLAFSYG